MSKPIERRETGEQDLFRSRLDQMIDMTHELVRLAQKIDWRFLEERFGEVYKDGGGLAPLPTRLMAGLAILKHTFNLSDEAVCARYRSGSVCLNSFVPIGKWFPALVMPRAKWAAAG